MKIQNNPDIERFFKRCIHNLTHETKNEFLGLRVTKANEREIQLRMKEAGFHEFQGEESTWPSLFISTQAHLQSPYHHAIKLGKIQNKDFSYTTETIPSNELFSVSSIQSDPIRELNESMILRALDEPYKATFLRQGKEVWMLDAPSEANTMDPYAKKAQGHVLTFGLGIGYFVYMAALNPEVQSITVIERSRSVIDLFESVFLPQFPKHIPISIIQGDAFNFFDEDYLNDYDYVFVDIWQSNDDGYLLIEKLLGQYLPHHDKVDFWIESSCFEFMPALIAQYFEALSRHQSLKIEDKQYRKVLKKIITYFERIETTIDSVDQLKHYMYDPLVLRSIAAIKI
jgi:hypothetical protein